MNFKKAVYAATRHLCESENARAYLVPSHAWGNKKRYVLDIEPDEDGVLVVTTWGFDFERFGIPQNWQELTSQKVRAQLRLMDNPYSPIDQIILRYSLDIIRREAQ